MNNDGLTFRDDRLQLEKCFVDGKVGIGERRDGFGTISGTGIHS